MSFRDCVSVWGSGKKLCVKKGKSDQYPSLENEINHLFDSFFQDWSISPFRFFEGPTAFAPQIDVSDNGKEIQIFAELPGLNEKDVEVSFSDGVVSIKGEKKFEDEKKEKNFYRVERSFGAFHRAFRVPVDVDESKIKAVFKKGILNVTLPKTEKAQQERKRIDIKTEE